jgi:hypothetical protein
VRPDSEHYTGHVAFCNSVPPSRAGNLDQDHGGCGAIAGLEPPWAHPISMHSLLAEVRAGERLEAILFGGFAVVALGIQRRGHEAGREWLARLFPASACAADRSDRSPCAKNRSGSRGLRLALSRVAIYVASLS